MRATNYLRLLFKRQWDQLTVLDICLKDTSNVKRMKTWKVHEKPIWIFKHFTYYYQKHDWLNHVSITMMFLADRKFDLYLRFRTENIYWQVEFLPIHLWYVLFVRYKIITGAIEPQPSIPPTIIFDDMSFSELSFPTPLNSAMDLSIRERAGV